MGGCVTVGKRQSAGTSHRQVLQCSSLLSGSESTSFGQSAPLGPVPHWFLTMYTGMLSFVPGGV